MVGETGDLGAEGQQRRQQGVAAWSPRGKPGIRLPVSVMTGSVCLGHEYIVMTDHSPNLTVANGLSTERLMRQLEEIEGVNAQLAGEAEAGAPPFRVLSGIEVDINEDGTLDQTPTCLWHSTSSSRACTPNCVHPAR